VCRNKRDENYDDDDGLGVFAKAKTHISAFHWMHFLTSICLNISVMETTNMMAQQIPGTGGEHEPPLKINIGVY